MTKEMTVSGRSDSDDDARRYEDFYKNLRARIRSYCESRMG